MTVALEFKGRPTHLRRRKNSSPSGPTVQYSISCLIRGLQGEDLTVEMAACPHFFLHRCDL